jgi:hypothetical protein
MLLLSEYTLLERISLGGSTLLYRAERCCDQQKVMLKILEPAGAVGEEKVRLTREYKFAGRFPGKGIARYLHLETWTWDAGKVGQLRFTENIVELMAGRI